GQSGGPFTSLLYGLSLAALAMVRATMLPFAFVGLIWFMFRCRTLQRGGLYAFLAFLGFANGLAPWTIRNFQKMGDLAPIADSAYLHLWIGNNPHATGGPLSAQEMQKALTELAQEDTQFAPDELAKRPQEARYRKLSAPVLAEVRANPGPTLRRRLGAALAFGLGEDYFRKGRLFEEGGAGAGTSIEKTSLEAMLAGALAAMFLLGLLGWRWSYGWRRLAMPASLGLIWVPLPYLLGHAEALHGPRLPLDCGLLTYAAFALMCMAATVGGFLFHGPA